MSSQRAIDLNSAYAAVAARIKIPLLITAFLKLIFTALIRIRFIRAMAAAALAAVAATTKEFCCEDHVAAFHVIVNAFFQRSRRKLVRRSLLFYFRLF